jgi:hypothetical protein
MNTHIRNYFKILGGVALCTEVFEKIMHKETLVLLVRTTVVAKAL